MPAKPRIVHNPASGNYITVSVIKRGYGAKKQFNTEPFYQHCSIDNWNLINYISIWYCLHDNSIDGVYIWV